MSGWLQAFDTLVIALLNLMLVAEVLLVFAGTMTRSVFSTSSMMCVDELFGGDFIFSDTRDFVRA